MFPVDLLSVDHADLTSASQKYLSSLESRPGAEEWFQSSATSKVCVTPQNISHLQLFDQPECVLLALHLSDDPTQVVAVYLPDRWWAVDDVLRTSNASRSGLQSVQSVMERVLVFLLSQVVDRPLQEEVYFSLHPPNETCKLLWREGEAVGFYSVKHKGSLCDGWSSRCYQVTVLDTVLVRRRCRRTGLGLHILDHFCNSFCSEDVLGLSTPLSADMVSVCRRFLQKHTEHRERLYEVEAPGGWAQRRNIWVNIQLGRYAHGLKGISLTSAETEQKEEDDSSEQVWTGADDAHQPNKDLMNSDHQLKVFDGSPDGGSLSSRFCGTGCGPPAHADDLDCGRPTTTPAKSHSTERRAVKRVHSTEDTVHSVHRKL